MDREERTHSDDHINALRGVGGGQEAAVPSEAMEAWLRRIRARIPAGAVLSATVRFKPSGGFFASFRLTNEGEVISSEARADTLERAAESAGRGLCQHLPPASEPGEEFPLAG